MSSLNFRNYNNKENNWLFLKARMINYFSKNRRFKN